MKGLGILYKKMKQYLKNIFFKTLDNFQNIMILLPNSAVLAVEWYIAHQVKGVDVFYTKIKSYFWKNFRKF